MIIYLKGLKSSKFVRVKAFPMYGGIGVSAPSLDRESTDSLIYNRVSVHFLLNFNRSRAPLIRTPLLFHNIIIIYYPNVHAGF